MAPTSGQQDLDRSRRKGMTAAARRERIAALRAHIGKLRTLEEDVRRQRERAALELAELEAPANFVLPAVRTEPAPDET